MGPCESDIRGRFACDCVNEFFRTNIPWIFIIYMELDLHEEHSQQRVLTEPSSSNPKSAKRAKKCASSEVKIKSKPTKDMKMHRLIFADGEILDGTAVAYIANGKKVLCGKKQGHGILCECCKSKISASQFEAHAGWSTRRKPYENIFLPNGVSLHAFSLLLKQIHENLAMKNGVCGECHKGGDLTLCDGCPRSFHNECILDTWRPLEIWFCKYCKDSMKRSESYLNDVAGLTVSGLNPIEEVEKRCIRIIDNPNKHDLVACSLCRSYEFSVDGFNDQTVIVCDQCELEFHIGCLREHYKANLKALPPGSWFCSVECGRLSYVIKVLVTRGAQKVPDTLVDTVTNLDVKWVVVHGKHASEEDKSLLAEAADIFHDGFNPIVDSVTGKDFIESMTYGKSIDASDFAGVHCAMLTTGSKVVTAGLFRVFGHDIVELPIVATSQTYQGKGYFKLFFTCFEKLLSFLMIKKLVVPAAEDTKAMWTNKFGFRRVTASEQSEYRKKQTSMVAFTGTSLLEKAVPEGLVTFEDNPFFDLNMG
ncbi:putative histone acetyltransferase chromatin regulator PHD family [Helianthus annuus]|nr:putative histone acetyltransferase chromatin regulator PHD family [Helianthus annuus]